MCVLATREEREAEDHVLFFVRQMKTGEKERERETVKTTKNRE